MKTALIQITIYDDNNLKVSEQLIRQYEGGYGYEIRDVFERLGILVSKIIDPTDPYHDAEA